MPEKTAEKTRARGVGVGGGGGGRRYSCPSPIACDYRAAVVVDPTASFIGRLFTPTRRTAGTSVVRADDVEPDMAAVAQRQTSDFGAFRGPGRPFACLFTFPSSSSSESSAASNRTHLRPLFQVPTQTAKHSRRPTAIAPFWTIPLVFRRPPPPFYR